MRKLIATFVIACTLLPGSALAQDLGTVKVETRPANWTPAASASAPC